MKIIDTSNEIQQCYPNGIFDITCWKKYADSIAPNFSNKIKNDTADYDFEQDILPVLQSTINNAQKLTAAHNSFVSATADLADKMREKLGTELDVTIVFYLGLCNGAGWATTLNKKPSILIGVEKVIELNWFDERNMQALIYHELGHIWHYGAKNTTESLETINEKALWHVYSEGIAMYVEQLLCGNMNFYHQDNDGWLDWCNVNRKNLYQEYVRRIDSGKSVQDFFGDWCSYNGKSDVGYYIGCELVKDLAEKYSLSELADLKLCEIENQLRKKCED